MRVDALQVVFVSNTYRSYSTLSVASSRSSLTSELRDVETPSPIPGAVGSYTEPTPDRHSPLPPEPSDGQGPVDTTQPVPEISIQNADNVEQSSSNVGEEVSAGDGGEVVATPDVTSVIDEDGFVHIQSDNTLTGSNELTSQTQEEPSVDSTALESASSPGNQVAESQVPPVESSPAAAEGATNLSLQDVGRRDNPSPSPDIDAVDAGTPDQLPFRPRVESTASKKSQSSSGKHEKKERFSLFKGSSKSGDKSKSSKKSGKKDKAKKNRVKDDRSMDDNQSEVSFQPDVDLASKPSVTKKAKGLSSLGVLDCMIRGTYFNGYQFSMISLPT